VPFWFCSQAAALALLATLASCLLEPMKIIGGSYIYRRLKYPSPPNRAYAAQPHYVNQHGLYGERLIDEESVSISRSERLTRLTTTKTNAK